MKSIIKKISCSLALMSVMVLGLVFVTGDTQVFASGCSGQGCVEQGIRDVNPGGGGTDAGSFSTFITNIINVLLFLIGVISVIFIILGGIRFVTSQGDASQVSSARNTILYAVIGLVVAMMAFAIVNWVVREI